MRHMTNFENNKNKLLTLKNLFAISKAFVKLFLKKPIDLDCFIFFNQAKPNKAQCQIKNKKLSDLFLHQRLFSFKKFMRVLANFKII